MGIFQRAIVIIFLSVATGVLGYTGLMKLAFPEGFIPFAAALVTVSLLAILTLEPKLVDGFYREMGATPGHPHPVRKIWWRTRARLRVLWRKRHGNSKRHFGIPAH